MLPVYLHRPFLIGASVSMGRAVKIPWVAGSTYHGHLPIVFRTSYTWYFDPLPRYIEILMHGISSLRSMVYKYPYPWYFDTPTHGISNPLSMVHQTPYPWYIEPHANGTLTVEPATHGILNPLPMVCQTHYPWYFYRPTHGILNPLPMVY
jgi:hypothetical protein